MFELKVSGLQEAPGLINTWATKTISILTPGASMPFPASSSHFFIHFWDVHNFIPGAPTYGDLEAILDFSKTFTDEDRVLVHCAAGISRSTAVAIAICIQHGLSYSDAFLRVRAIRPEMRPNRLLTRFTDTYFALAGKLITLVKQET